MRAEPRAGSRRHLGLGKTLADTLRFCLRHFVVLYPLGLLTDLPSFIHSFSAGQRLWSFRWWIETTAVLGLEILVIGCVAAVMARSRMHDRKREKSVVLKTMLDCLDRFPVVAGLCLIYAAFLLCGTGLFSVAAAVPIIMFLPFVFLMLLIALAFLTAVFSVSVVAAAIEHHTVLACLERGAKLTEGNRWRVVATLFFAILPLLIGHILLVFFGASLSFPDRSPIWAFLIYGLFTPYYLALPAVLYEAVVILKEGPDPQTRAAVFD